jgi:hypothetical protein
LPDGPLAAAGREEVGRRGPREIWQKLWLARYEFENLDWHSQRIREKWAISDMSDAVLCFTKA